MSFPNFVCLVPTLVLRDPLAEILGAARGGLIDYSYADAVRVAGHSCPTVAGAWLMTRRALEYLWRDEVPERGAIAVALRAAADAGTAGVTGLVIGAITGAAGEGGFKGLGGRFVRRGLLTYGIGIDGEVRFRRTDTGAEVTASYHPEVAPPDPAMQRLAPRVLGGEASAEERVAFGRLWQDRVRRLLLEHGDDPELVRLT
ncbi:MAG: hypothetical protein HY778_08790 [Betaproteobacteria bacterium]|nr:hypothetical protein [Betaproteobacteria bacterium]